MTQKNWLRGAGLASLGLLLLLGFQNCGQPMAAGEDGLTLDSLGASLGSRTAVCSFNGEVLASGQIVTAYLTSSVEKGANCVSQERECKDGQLSGSYRFASCEVEAARSCIHNGLTIPHGGQVTAFQNSSAAYGTSCQSQVRNCNDGVLDGTYAYASCGVEAAQSCLFNGQTIPSGESVVASKESAVAYGKSCESQTRTCTNGVLSGSYAFASCAVGAAGSCLFNGETIPNNGNVVAYSKSAVAYNATCTAQLRVCKNGKLSGTYAFGSCAVTPVQSCLFNGETIAHGQKVAGYAYTMSGGILKCVTKQRTCTNGILSEPNYTKSACDL